MSSIPAYPLSNMSSMAEARRAGAGIYQGTDIYGQPIVSSHIHGVQRKRYMGQPDQGALSRRSARPTGWRGVEADLDADYERELALAQEEGRAAARGEQGMTRGPAPAPQVSGHWVPGVSAGSQVFVRDEPERPGDADNEAAELMGPPAPAAAVAEARRRQLAEQNMRRAWARTRAMEENRIHSDMTLNQAAKEAKLRELGSRGAREQYRGSPQGQAAGRVDRPLADARREILARTRHGRTMAQYDTANRAVSPADADNLLRVYNTPEARDESRRALSNNI